MTVAFCRKHNAHMYHSGDVVCIAISSPVTTWGGRLLPMSAYHHATHACAVAITTALSNGAGTCQRISLSFHYYFASNYLLQYIGCTICLFSPLNRIAFGRICAQLCCHRSKLCLSQLYYIPPQSTHSVAAAMTALHARPVKK